MTKRIFYFFAILLFVACSDDEQFTTSRTDVLALPDDTLRMDTVFSGNASATYTFWVRNRNANALRISRVALADGTRGFRVNVDGEYLNPAVADIELLGEDSLLVFVELTALTTGKTDPQPVDEQLVFTLESGVEQRVLLRAWAWDAVRWEDRTVTGDEVVTGEAPVLVSGTLTVAEGASLTLRGTRLFFHDGAGIDVRGTLTADGATLRGDRLDRMFSYLPYDHISGQWRGVSVAPSGSCRLTDCDVHGAHDALTAAAGSRLELTRSVVHNNEGTGISAEDATVDLAWCQVSNASGRLVSVSGGSLTLRQCTLAQYYPFSLRDVALSVGSGTELLVSRLLVAGYEDELLSLGEGVEIPETECFKAGKDDFVLVDEVNLTYDFHLKPDSEASGFGCY